MPDLEYEEVLKIPKLIYFTYIIIYMYIFVSCTKSINEENLDL